MTEPTADGGRPRSSDPDLVDQVDEIIPGAWNEEEHVRSDEDGVDEDAVEDEGTQGS